MSEYNNQESSSCNNLMQVEDKVFKGIMIFNLIRMGLSAGLILLTFKELMLIMTNGFLFYGLLSIGTVVLCLGIAIATIQLRKQTVLLQVILMGLTILMICSNIALGGGMQIPFMDIVMTYYIVKNKHFFVN